MILSDRTLFKMLEAGTLSITPLDKEQVQPASVDIRLGIPSVLWRIYPRESLL